MWYRWLVLGLWIIGGGSCQLEEAPYLNYGKPKQLGHIACITDSVLLHNQTLQAQLFRALHPPQLAHIGIDTLWHLHFVAMQDYDLFLKNLNTELWILPKYTHPKYKDIFTPQQQAKLTKNQYLNIEFDYQKGKKRLALLYTDSSQFSQILQQKQQQILYDIITTDNQRLDAFKIFHQPLQRYIQTQYALTLPISIYFDISHETTTELRLKNYKTTHDIEIWIEPKTTPTPYPQPLFWDMGQKIAWEDMPNHWKFYTFVKKQTLPARYGKVSLLISKNIPKTERIQYIRFALMLFSQVRFLD